MATHGTRSGNGRGAGRRDGRADAGRIRGGAQRRALASPAKQEIIDALEAAGPSTIGDLAALIGRPADGLYFHVRTLVRVGLVVEAGERGAGRSLATVYDVMGRPMRLSYDVGEEGRRELSKVVAAAVRMSLREFQRACVSGASAEGPARELWGGRAKGWLTDEELARAGAMVEGLVTLLRSGKPGPGKRAVGFGFVVAPSRNGAARPDSAKQ